MDSSCPQMCAGWPVLGLGGTGLTPKPDLFPPHEILREVPQSVLGMKGPRDRLPAASSSPVEAPGAAICPDGGAPRPPLGSSEP